MKRMHTPSSGSDARLLSTGERSGDSAMADWKRRALSSSQGRYKAATAADCRRVLLRLHRGQCFKSRPVGLPASGGIPLSKLFGAADAVRFHDGPWEVRERHQGARERCVPEFSPDLGPATAVFSLESDELIPWVQIAGQC